MGLTQKISEKRREYERYYRSSGIRLEFNRFILIMLAVAVAAAVLSAFLVQLLPSKTADNTAALTVVTFAAICSLVLAVPFSLRNARIEKIEDNLPDALKHMAVVLKAGGTVENAIEEASRAEYGPLSEELESALLQLRRGKIFEEVVRDAALYSGSKLFERVSIIITDAKKAGAGLAETMSAIADDAREVNRIRRERKARTMMHTTFLYASSLFLSPFIFGFTLTIVSFIGTGINCALPSSTPVNLGFLNDTLTLFIAVETTIAIFAVGLIREGKMLRYLVRVPIMILIALLLYEVGKRVGQAIIGGNATC